MQQFLEGLLIGFAIAAPVGPIGLLCIRRSIVDGHLAGFITGLGAATADAIYGLVAALGLAWITAFLTAHATQFRVVGTIFLLVIGITTLRSRPPQRSTASAHAPSLTSAFFSTLFLTLANPMTLAAFLGIFTISGVGLETTTNLQAAKLVGGVFTGSAAWWLILSTASGWFAKHITDGGLRLVNIVAGGLITAFGLWQLAKLVLR